MNTPELGDIEIFEMVGLVFCTVTVELFPLAVAPTESVTVAEQ